MYEEVAEDSMQKWVNDDKMLNDDSTVKTESSLDDSGLVLLYDEDEYKYNDQDLYHQDASYQHDVHLIMNFNTVLLELQTQANELNGKDDSVVQEDDDTDDIQEKPPPDEG